jgi:hypothetical protein
MGSLSVLKELLELPITKWGPIVCAHCTYNPCYCQKPYTERAELWTKQGASWTRQVID